MEVINDLPVHDRKVLLRMAAIGALDTSAYLDILLIELASFKDLALGDCFARRTKLPPADSREPQRVLSVFVISHVLGLLGLPLPMKRSFDCCKDSALSACGEIIYWCNRSDLDETLIRSGCGRLLRELVGPLADAALDVIRLCERILNDHTESLRGERPIERSIVSRFPDEAVQICRHSLSNPTSQVRYFRDFAEFKSLDNLTFAIEVLAEHGSHIDLWILREYSRDQLLGTDAVEAVRAIEERLASS